MMHDAEGTELQPGDIVEWLTRAKLPPELYMVTEKQDVAKNFAGEAMVRVKCFCEDCQSDGVQDVLYIKQTNVRLVERMPTPEYYEHTRSG